MNSIHRARRRESGPAAPRPEPKLMELERALRDAMRSGAREEMSAAHDESKRCVLLSAR